MKRLVTRALIVVASILGIVFAQVPQASAQEPDLNGNLAALWTRVLQTKASQNPFGTGGSQFACWDLGDNTVAPFAGGENFSCKVKSDTKLFVVGWSTECSTFDNDCGRENDPPDCPDIPPEDLLACAVVLSGPHATPAVTLDGDPVAVRKAFTPTLNVVLPKHNVFGEPGGTQGQFAAYGLGAALIGPLSPGTHKIVITDPTTPQGVFPTTTIVVTPDE